MDVLARWLDELLGGLLWIALASAVGGVVWEVCGVRAWRCTSGAERVMVARGVTVLSVGAVGVALAQSLQMAVKAWLLLAAFGQSPFPAIVHTLSFQAGGARALLALGLGLVAWGLRKRPAARRRWAGVSLLAAGVLLSGAWLSHAVGRTHARVALMTLTVLHEAGGAIWLGGVIHLSALWGLARQRPELREVWVLWLWRFSGLAAGAVLLSLTAGVALAWSYVGTWQGLVGTGYGSLVVAKGGLLTGALALGGVNFWAVHRRRHQRVGVTLSTQVPGVLEGEILLLSGLMMVAVALASLPPAADTPDEQARGSEIAAVFWPKWPRLTSPSLAAVLPGASGASADGAEALRVAKADWSDFNHNVAGLCVLVIGGCGLAAQVWGGSWARHWPLGWVALAAFLLVRSDPSDWPLGPTGWWDGLWSAEVLQHRLATLLAAGLGLLEWRARTASAPRPWVPYLFPGLCALGGVLLLTHAHGALEPQQEFLMQVSHTAMGVLALITACGRWLELRLAPPAGRFAGLSAHLALLGIGVLLIFYREPLG
jgi:putative copper resistance protein D